MTLLEIKKRTLELIEEIKEATEEDTSITSDEDIEAKINGVINQVQIELAQIKRISAKHTFNYVDSYEFDLPEDFYQVDKIKCEYYIYGNKIVLDTIEDSIDMYYYKYPTVIDNETEDSAELEVTLDCQNAMPYGVAYQLLITDPSAESYRNEFKATYNELKSQLRLSSSSPMLYIDTTNAINE